MRRYTAIPNKGIIVVLNAHLCSKEGQGHSVSTTVINLEDIALKISMSLSLTSLKKIQLKPRELFRKQG